MVQEASAVTKQDTATRKPPTSLAQARKCTGADDWKAAFEQQKKMHELFGTFEYVDRATLPADDLITQPI